MNLATKISDMIICRGDVDDAAELASFAARSFEETYAAENNPSDLRDYLSTNYGLQQQLAELADPLIVSILARSKGELVAFAQVRQNGPPPCVTHASPIELHRFYLDQRVHGSGLASKLMEQVHQAAHDLGGRHIWLSVLERNPRAIAFYRKTGFMDVGGATFMVGTDRQEDRVLVAQVKAQERQV